VADRLLGQPVGLEPGRRGPVQFRHPFGPLLVQAGAEQIGEQLVVAPPAAVLVERLQEQVGLFDLPQ
jgi:hypothetical protein